MLQIRPRNPLKMEAGATLLDARKARGYPKSRFEERSRSGADGVSYRCPIFSNFQPKWAPKWGPIFSEIRRTGRLKMAQNDPSSEKPRKQGIPKRIPFWDQFRNQFWVEFELKIMVSGKVPGAIWHYYSNGFRVLKGSALQLAAEPLRNPFWRPFWNPFWSQNPKKIVQRAARRDFRATQEAREGEEKGVQKWTQKWIAKKTVGSRKRDRRPPYTGGFQVHGEGYREG